MKGFFSERIILRSPPPWVVHLRFGNLPRRYFHALLAKVWPQVETLLKTQNWLMFMPTGWKECIDYSALAMVK